MYQTESMDRQITRRVRFHYLCYTPKDYNPTEKYPLVIFLHGAGERGDDPALVARYGFLKQAAEGKEFPFLIAAPQCPNNQSWGNYLESLNDFLDEIIERYSVDQTRIYLTGLSMGGTGTWHWLMANPERFAAAAPVCGTGIYWYACRIANKPIWMFHGNADTVVPVSESLAMEESLKKSGGSPRLTVLDGVGHNAWDYAYTDELANWFLQYSL